MTQTLFLANCRAILVAIIAYCAGRGWLTPADSGALTAVLVPIGALVGPWIWIIYANINAKLVPHDSVAISPEHVMTRANPVGSTAMVGDSAGSVVAAKVVGALIAAFVLSFLLAGNPAEAQTKLGPIGQKIANDFAGKATDKSAATLDNIAAALAKPFKDIADFIGADADGAVKLATVIPALQDGHGQQCWIAMKSFGDIVQAHPVPITFHVLQDYETLRLLGMATNNLCANTHCTQVFADLTSMAQAASPMPLAIPSLHDLCTKVPQIASIPAISVPSPQADPAAPK